MRKFNFNPITLMLAVGFGSLVACAHDAPRELVEARDAYRRAAAGQASRLAPAELDTAKTALEKAEKMFEDEGDDAIVGDWAYVATRKAQLAEVKALTQSHNEQKIIGQKKIETAMQDKITSTKEELADSRQQNQEAKTDLAAQEADAAQKELAASKDALATEQQARTAVEEQNKALVDRLAENAKVTKEERGTVISLSGSVLFASGRSSLLPGASATLDNVATALNEQKDQTITIEGHTDSVGSDAMNQTLSLGRAQAVREYLVGRAVPAARVNAIGLGETRPIADNATAEGRANNRRVEIILSPARS